MFGIDDALLGGAIGGIANLVGGLFTNSANSANAQQAEQFSAQQTNTSYQRAVADMKAAGLNPMLAYSQGGASSAQGVVANVTNPAPAAVQGFQSGVSSAQAASMAELQRQNLAASTAATQASAKASLASAANQVAQAQTTNATRPSVVLKSVMDATNTGDQGFLLRAQQSKASADSDYYKSPVGRALYQLGLGAGQASGTASSAASLARTIGGFF